jgi:hypothetical protein
MSFLPAGFCERSNGPFFFSPTPPGLLALPSPKKRGRRWLRKARFVMGLKCRGGIRHNLLDVLLSVGASGLRWGGWYMRWLEYLSDLQPAKRRKSRRAYSCTVHLCAPTRRVGAGLAAKAGAFGGGVCPLLTASRAGQRPARWCDPRSFQPAGACEGGTDRHFSFPPPHPPACPLLPQKTGEKMAALSQWVHGA